LNSSIFWCLRRRECSQFSSGFVPSMRRPSRTRTW
jgi:hypothetical protein